MSYTKKCKRCNRDRPVSLFYKDASKHDGLQSNCIPCRKDMKGITERQKQRQIRERQKRTEMVFTSHWRSIKNDWIKSDRYKEWAKKEHVRKGLQRDRNNPEKARERKKRWEKRNPEKVRELRRKWARENPEARNRSRKNYRQRNREKLNERRRIENVSNPEEIRKKRRDYYAKNRDRILEKAKAKRLSKIGEVKRKEREYRNKNRKKLTDWQVRYVKERKKTDPLFALRVILRSRTTAAFKAKGYRKKSKTAELLGCPWEMLKDHIEKQFTKGMNWNNRGEWEIDHIIPLASAKNKKELNQLCHFSNLQPLWKDENRCKSASVIDCQPELPLIH